MCPEKPVCACLLRQEVGFPHRTTVLQSRSIVSERGVKETSFSTWQKSASGRRADNAVGLPLTERT